MELKDFLTSIEYTWYVFEGIVLEQNLKLVNFIERLVQIFGNLHRSNFRVHARFGNMELDDEPALAGDFIKYDGDTLLVQR